MSCCSVCQAGAPRAIAVVLDGYSGVLHVDLNNSAGHGDLDPVQDSLHPSWTQFGSVPHPYILYYEGGSGGCCNYSLINGPGLVKDDTVDTGAGINVHSYRPTLSATLCLTNGVPTVTVTVGGFSVFTGAVAASAPIDCTAINDVSLPLTSNSCGPLSDGASATCRVWLLGPQRDCVTAVGPCSPPVSGAGPLPTPNRYSHLRQPGGTKKCFSDNQCDCCVCNLDGRPTSFRVRFSGWTDNGCAPFNTGFFDLPYQFTDPEGNCFYGTLSSIFGYYLLLKLGFAGDPSSQCVYLSLYMLHGYTISMGASIPFADFIFELDHVEYCWLENLKQIPWRGKGTFPCCLLGEGVTLPLQVDNGEANDGAFCDEDQIGSPSVNVTASCGPAEAGGCCCPNTENQHGPGTQNLFVCFSSDDANCPLSGVLAGLQKNGASWSGTVELDNGNTLTITASYGSGGWTVAWNCGGSGGTASFPALNSPAQTASAGSDCCAGDVTVGLSNSPGGCPGKITAAATGCCGCTTGAAPPPNLLLTIAGSSWDGTLVQPNCAPCAETLCDGWGGSYVLDYKGLVAVSGCNSGTCSCQYCFYNCGPIPIAQVCDFQGNFGDHNTYLGFQVQLHFDRSVVVLCSVEGPGGICQPLPGSTFSGSLPAGSVTDCTNFNLTIPIAKGGICNVPPTVQVQTL